MDICSLGYNVLNETPFESGNYSFPSASALTDKQRQTNMVEIINRLLASGLPNMTLEVACGIAANIRSESNFNPTAVGDHGTSYGLCQWHNIRIDRLKNFCKANNFAYNTIEGQVNFLIYELMNKFKNTYKTISSDSNRHNVDRVATNFCLTFEVPKDKETVCKTRGGKAKSVLDQYRQLTQS